MKKERLTLRLSTDLHEWLTNRAQANQKSLSATTNDALETFRNSDVASPTKAPPFTETLISQTARHTQLIASLQQQVSNQNQRHDAIAEHLFKLKRKLKKRRTN